jgi:hypothetical protein
MNKKRKVLLSTIGLIIISLFITALHSQNASLIKSGGTDASVPTNSRGGFREYEDDFLKIRFPANLEPITDYFFCDTSNCNDDKYVAFLSSTHIEVNRINQYQELSVEGLTDAQIHTRQSVVINEKEFIHGYDPVWKQEVYWIQGKGYALQILFNPSVTNKSEYIDLASLELK